MSNIENEKPKRGNKKQLSKQKTLCVFLLILAMSCLSVFMYSNYKNYEEHLRQNRQLVCAVNLQMEKNIDNYLHKLEDAGKILFSHEEYIEYNAVSSKNDGYTALSLENQMTDFLVSLSAMDNYSDFGIIYSNNHTVGRVNNGTVDLYGSDLYKALNDALGDRKTCWTTGYNGNYKRLYYLRRVNDNAILTASIYTEELSAVFVDSKQLGNIKTMLTDERKRVIYSSENKALGMLDEEYAGNWQEDADFTVVDSSYIQSVNACGSDWHIVSIFDLGEQNLMFKKVVVVCFAIVLVAMLMMIAFAFIIDTSSHSREAELSSLKMKMKTVDGLTGLCNAETAENLIAEKIETCITGSTIMLALVSIKNLDLIEENYGITGVNEALLCVSAMLQEIYGDENIVGKTGDNEFEIFADFTEYDLFKAHDKLKNSLKTLGDKLKNCQLSSDRGYIKCCVGAGIYPDSSSDYDDLYECAKKSLEEALSDSTSNVVLHNPQKQKKGG